MLWSSNEVNKGHLEELRLFGDSIANDTETPISFREIIETTAVALEVEDLLHGRDTSPAQPQ